MYPDLDEARSHAERATGIYRTSISIVREPEGFTLHVGPPAEADVVAVVDYTP